MKNKLLILVALMSVLMIGAVSAATINVPGDQANITAAIANATAGDTILVADGTYSGESIDVNKANLTIQAVNGSSAVTLDLNISAQVCLKVSSTGTGLILGGATGKGFTITCGGAVGRIIELENAPANVEISYNTLNTSGVETMGISVGAAGSSGLIIDNNAFVGGESGDGYVWAALTSDVTITDNTFTFPSAAASGYAIEVEGAGGTSVITGNTITNAANAIFILDGTVNTSDLNISGNTIATCVNGLRFYSGYKVGGIIGSAANAVSITDNAISGCAKAIVISAGTDIIASNFYVYQNNFAGNTIGVDNNDAETLTAEYNYWGVTGPTLAAYVSGTDYSPYYTDVAMTTLEVYPGSGTSPGGYYFTYEMGDFDDIITDGLGTAGAEIVSWLDIVVFLIVLVAILGAIVVFVKSKSG